MREDWSRRGVFSAGLALVAAGARPGWAQTVGAVSSAPASPIPPAPADPAPQSIDDLVTLDLSEDGVGRMTVPVRVNGQGPFPFMVDTGADHSVLSQELAAMLGLPPAGIVHVAGIAGVQDRPLAKVARLEVGGRVLSDAPMALLPRRHLGALGYVGLDSLKGQRLAIDFVRRQMEVRRSRGRPQEPGEIVVYGKSRFGQLMLIDSSVWRRPVYVILDSGAQNTIGNSALRSFTQARRRQSLETQASPKIELDSVTGQSLMGEGAQLTDLVLGDVSMRQIPIIYADLHTFSMFKLDTQPALMLGMDTLRSFDGVTVDFGRREVSFQLPKPLAS